MMRLFLFIISFFSLCIVYSQTVEFDSVYVHNPNDQDGRVSVRWEIDLSQTWDSILIYRKTNFDDSFSYRGKVISNNIQFIDDSLCGVDVRYALTLFNSGTSADSDTTKSEYENDSPPEIPFLYSLNYVNDSIELNWNKSEDETAIGYSFISYENIFDTIALINDPNQTTYKMGKDVFPCSQQDRLLMITRDLCASSTNVSENYLQSLTLIENLANDKCDRSVTINFSEYIPAEGLNQRILNHELWVSENGNDSTLLATLPEGSSQYVHEGINSGSDYQYLIKTILETGGDTVSSFCCPKAVATEEVPLPDYFNLVNVSVTDDEHVELKVRADTVSVNGYAIYRNTEGEIPQLLAQLPPQSEATWFFTDSTANTDSESYFYDIKVIDECGIEAMTADITSRSILLSVETENNTNFLDWNDYEGWPIDAYVVYRYAPGSDNGTELAELPPGFTTYEDLVNESPEEGQWRYRVQAFAMNSREETWSNYANANQETFIRMPNAFRPEGNTSYLFKPVYTNLTPSNYQMFIYNRWGQLIFESESPQTGWDGTYEGSFVQSGTYIYYISYEDNNGEIKTKKGSVLVIR